MLTRFAARAVLLVSAAALAGTALTSCGGSAGSALPTGGESVELDPARFTSQIDNPWMPLRPGARWTYRLTYPDGRDRRTVVTVLEKTREVMGIEARVVHDVETEDGEVVEETYDWYAQDSDRNVWYFGEDTRTFEDGKLTTRAGSWEAGVNGGQPGILFPARPELGLTYRQEFYGQDDDDEEEIVRVDETVQVSFGSFEDVVMTRDVTPDEAEAVQYKFFARGVGLVLAIDLSGGNGRETLVAHTTS